MEDFIFGIRASRVAPDRPRSLYLRTARTVALRSKGRLLVVTSKIVSKAEGRIVRLEDVQVSPFARQYAERTEKEPAIVELVLQESKRVVRQVGPIMITETRHGFICANAGIDQSSSGGHGLAVLLPADPDASCARLRAALKQRGLDVAVIISDTFGRPWREAQTDIAIGIAGMRRYHLHGSSNPHARVPVRPSARRRSRGSAELQGQPLPRSRRCRPASPGRRRTATCIHHSGF